MTVLVACFCRLLMFARCFYVGFCFCFVFLADLSVLVFPASKIMGGMTSVFMILDGFNSDDLSFVFFPVG